MHSFRSRSLLSACALWICPMVRYDFRENIPNVNDIIIGRPRGIHFRRTRFSLNRLEAGHVCVRQTWIFCWLALIHPAAHLAFYLSVFNNGLSRILARKRTACSCLLRSRSSRDRLYITEPLLESRQSPPSAIKKWHGLQPKIVGVDEDGGNRDLSPLSR